MCKKLLSVILCLFAVTCAMADVNVTKAEDGTVTIAVSGEAGQIGEEKSSYNNDPAPYLFQVGVSEDAQGLIKSAKSIVITGNISKDDMKTLTKFCCGNLESLDLSGAFYNENIRTSIIDWTLYFHSFMPNNYTSMSKLTSFSFPQLAEGVTSIVPANFGAWCCNLNHVVIPEGYTAIGDNAFNYGTNDDQRLRSVSMPDGIVSIGKSAFYRGQFGNIVLPNSLKTIGEGAFGQCVKMSAITFPAVLDTIGKDAFYNCKLKDVYFLGRTAPANVDPEAFGVGLYTGWGGFNAPVDGKTATRDNYKNGDNWFCMLHLRADLTAEERLTYRDPTRVYKLEKQYNVGAGLTYTYNYQTYSCGTDVEPGYVDKYVGEDYVWPCQTQYDRAYVTSMNGKLWDGKTNISATGSIALYAFVFDQADVTQERTDEWKFPNLKPDMWYTICVPMNMTKAQVTSVFGENTQVCKFNEVIRKTTGTDKGIKLHFTDEQHIGKAEDYISIEAHHSYMIKPSGLEEDFDSSKGFVLKNYIVEPGGVQPTILSPEGQSSTYMFIGNYLSKPVAKDASVTYVTMPQYSYFLGAASNGDHKLFFQKGTTGKFGQYTAVVETSNGENDYTTFFTSATSPSKGVVSLFGLDGNDNTTDINVEVIAGATDKDNRIYNMNGQLVSEGNNISLPKGLYIKNGKKFIVK